MAATALAGLLLRSAQADEPRRPRLIGATTAWLQPRDTVYGTAGASHRGGALIALSAGLGGLAEVDLELAAGGERFAGDGRAATALCKIGLGPGLLWRRSAAVAVGFRRSLRTASQLELAELTAVASLAGGGFGLHAGGELWPGGRARPLAGLEWVPPIYPRTTLLADLAWAAAPGGPADLRWTASWGVRYQALSWGSIELAVRHREAEELGGATVLVRVNGVLSR